MDQTIEKRLRKAVDDGFEEQIDLTKELIKCPSIRGQEHTAQDMMAREMADRSLDVDQWKIELKDISHLPGFSPVAVSYENAWNVVGTHRSSIKSGRSLILNGHIDVVPPGPVEMWSSPPFEPRVADGWLHGRGASDMKSGLVANLFALSALRRAGFVPANDVYVQSVIEEESTGNGALACLARGYKAEAAFVTEPFPDLLKAQGGVMWLQVVVHGNPAHASGGLGARKTVSNAIENAMILWQALKSLERSWNDQKGQYPEFANHPRPINFVIGKIQGGDWTSNVPAFCCFDMRIGFYIGRDLADVRAEIENCIMEAANTDEYMRHRPPEIIYNGFQAEGSLLDTPGAQTARQTLQQAHRIVFGKDPFEMVSPATTDARFFAQYADTPALVYGPEGRCEHAFDEAVNLESVRKVTQTIVLFISEWCGLKEI